MNLTAYRMLDIIKMMRRDNVKINSRTLMMFGQLYDPTFFYTERWIRRMLRRLCEHGAVEHVSRADGYRPVRINLVA